MKESELKIDWKKHVCYSKQAKKVIRKRIAEQFDAGETEKRWEDVQLKYVEYLETLPYLGERKTDIKDAAEEQRCPAGYRMYAEPFDPDTGIHYRFEQCPIAEFAKAHDLLEIMPAMCNGDYPAMELLHAGLIRKTTCANADVCDYWIVGDQSPYLREYPKQTDARGYIYNEKRRINES